MEKIQIEEISWVAPEYTKREKNIDWFWGVGILALVGAGCAFYFSNILFGIFIIIATVTLFIFHIRDPRDITYTINNDGITMFNKTYTLDSITGWNVKEYPLGHKLIIETNDRFMPIISIPITDDLILPLETEFKKIAEEKPIEETRMILLMEKLGF